MIPVPRGCQWILLLVRGRQGRGGRSWDQRDRQEEHDGAGHERDSVSECVGIRLRVQRWQ